MIQRKDWDLSEYSYKEPEKQGNLYIGESGCGSSLGGRERKRLGPWHAGPPTFGAWWKSEARVQCEQCD